MVIINSGNAGLKSRDLTVASNLELLFDNLLTVITFSSLKAVAVH